MKLDACHKCQSKMEYVTAVPQGDGRRNTIVCKCGACDTVIQFDQPDDWIENGYNYNHINAREQGTSFVRDIKPEEEIKQTLKELQSVPSNKIDEEFVRAVAAKAVLQTMLANCISKRPTVRQRAAEALAKITFKPAQQSVDVTSGGKAIKYQGLSREELLAHTAGLVDRLTSLNQSKDEDSGTDS